MQYLVSVIDDGAGLATPSEEAAIGAFNDRLKAEGHWVFAGGLGSPDPATVIDNRGSEAVFTDGPFVGGRSPLLRTPLPRSDTTSGNSFNDSRVRRVGARDP